jgi:hypothetical protein
MVIIRHMILERNLVTTFTHQLWRAAQARENDFLPICPGRSILVIERRRRTISQQPQTKVMPPGGKVEMNIWTAS